MGIWIAGGDDLVGNECDESSNDNCRKSIPLPEEAGDRLIELQHQVVETHDGGERVQVGMLIESVWILLKKILHTCRRLNSGGLTQKHYIAGSGELPHAKQGLLKVAVAVISKVGLGPNCILSKQNLSDYTSLTHVHPTTMLT